MKIIVAVVLLLGVLLVPFSTVSAQVQSLTFPETGKTISGRFLEYWKANGGLAQQGYPINDMISEKSDTNGQIYTVQYFERAVFEAHPENTTPNDVLLSLLGVFLYKQKYPAGAPGQTPNNDAGAQLFAQTGKRVGGVFLTYWQQHGGLAQQGLPISDEFIETSSLDNKPYKVQYFERAVFEYHPENVGTPYEVLLSQVGKFRYQGKYSNLGAGATPQATATPAQPEATPTVPVNAANLDCNNIPEGTGVVATPNCGPYGTEFNMTSTGFQPGEEVKAFITRPDNTTGLLGAVNATAQGNVTGFGTMALSPVPGVWAVTIVGSQSKISKIGYYKVTGEDFSGCKDGPPPPGTGDASVAPACGRAGFTTFSFAARGFIPNEQIAIYWTQSNGQEFEVQGGHSQARDDGFIVGATMSPYAISPPGVWACTFQGLQSGHKAIVYFKVYTP